MPEPTHEIDAVVRALARLSLTKPDGRSCPLPLALAVGIEDYREDQRLVFEAIELIARAALAAVLREPSADLLAVMSLAIRGAEGNTHDLEVGEAMEGTSWLAEYDIQALCDAAALVALRAAGRHILGDPCDPPPPDPSHR